MIWHKKDLLLQEIIHLGKGTMGEHIGIAFTEVGPDYIKASMPVDGRTRQPYGLLHGGASCVLAETLGSVASALVIDPEKVMCVGLELHAIHVRGVRGGRGRGRATPLHLGAATRVWDIKMHDERDKLVCVSRLTVAILH